MVEWMAGGGEAAGERRVTSDASIRPQSRLLFPESWVSCPLDLGLTSVRLFVEQLPRAYCTHETCWVSGGRLCLALPDRSSERLQPDQGRGHLDEQHSAARP